MNVTDNLAIIAGKLSASVIRTLGAGLGSNLPGRVARTLSPGVLSRLACQPRLGVLAVSGTNGKSTTSGLLFSILQHAGLKAVHNRQGANLATGITASVVDAASWGGRLDADYCLFEVDEAVLPVVAREMAIKAVIVTNLFRDQLDRFGELDTTAKLIDKGISTGSSQCILNADDPNVAQLAPGHQRLFYGIESLSPDTAGLTPGTSFELSYCPDCGNEYTYTLKFYGQLGHYHCQKCRRARPTPAVAASGIVLGPSNSTFSLTFNGSRTIDIRLSLPGLFNVYNALAASALAFWLGIEPSTIDQGLSDYTTLFGRSEKLKVDGKEVLIQLIKNPAGASQVVASVLKDDRARLVIAINDNLADGRDISWLWDADFELLSSHARPIIVSGQRAEDMALRLKYAGVATPQIMTVTPLDRAIKRALAETQPDETLWILPTYTCLLELKKVMKALGHTLAGTG